MNRVKRKIIGLTAFLWILLLTACGADVDTELSISPSFSGYRTITCTLSNADLNQYISGGFASLEKTIEGHLPQDYSYDLYQEGSNTIAVFRLDFKELDEYKEAVLNILGDRGDAPEIIFEIQDSLFKNGFYVEENFTSLELLQWLSDGIVADGISSYADTSNFFSMGETRLVYGDRTYHTNTPISAGEMDKNCMDSIEVTTWIKDNGYKRRIVFSMGQEAYGNLGSSLDAFMEKNVPAGAEMEKDSQALTWAIVFEAGDEKTIQDLTNEVLQRDNTVFELQEIQEGEPLLKRVSVIQLNDGSYYCDNSGAASVKNIIAAEKGFAYIHEASAQLLGDAWVTETYEDENYYVFSETLALEPYGFVLERRIPLKRVDISTALSRSGAVSRTIDIVIGKENAAAAGDGLKIALQDGLSDGMIFMEDLSGEETVYTLSFAGDAGEMSTVFSGYTGGGEQGFQAGKLKTGTIMRAAYFCMDNIDLTPLLGEAVVEDGVKYSVAFPSMQRAMAQSLSGAGKISMSGNTVSLSTGPVQGVRLRMVSSSQGTSIAGIFILIMITAGICGCAVFFYMNRGALKFPVKKTRPPFVKAKPASNGETPDLDVDGDAPEEGIKDEDELI